MPPLGVSSLTPYEIQPSLMALPVTSHTIIDEEKQEQNCSMRGGGGRVKNKGQLQKRQGQ